MVKALVILLSLVAGSNALASQRIHLGLNSSLGIDLNSKFLIEICPDSPGDCKPVGKIGRFEISVESLKRLVESDPNLAKSPRLKLKWGYFEVTECCGEATKPWLFAEVILETSEIKSGQIHTVYFPDNTYVSDLKCNAIQPFKMNQTMSVRGYVGTALGEFSLFCYSN